MEQLKILLVAVDSLSDNMSSALTDGHSIAEVAIRLSVARISAWYCNPAGYMQGMVADVAGCVCSFRLTAGAYLYKLNQFCSVFLANLYLERMYKYVCACTRFTSSSIYLM